MGYRIFVLCLRQVLLNIKVAFQLSWMWIVLMIGLSLAAGIAFSGLTAGNSGGGIFANFLIFLVVFIILLLNVTSIAIGWHRYVLREESPPQFHVINTKWPLGSYIWKSIKIALLFMLIFIPIMLIASPFLPSVLLQVSNQSSNLTSTLLTFMAISLPINIFALWVLLRIGLVLPASAVGNQISIKEAFRTTSGYAGQLAITATLLALLYSIPGLFQILFLEIPNPQNISEFNQFQTGNLIFSIVTLAFNWFTFFVSVGILTVLYGHLCEERPI